MVSTIPRPWRSGWRWHHGRQIMGRHSIASQSHQRMWQWIWFIIQKHHWDYRCHATLLLARGVFSSAGGRISQIWTLSRVSGKRLGRLSTGESHHDTHVVASSSSSYCQQQEQGLNERSNDWEEIGIPPQELQITETLETPLGLLLAENTKEGCIHIESIKPHSHADIRGYSNLEISRWHVLLLSWRHKVTMSQCIVEIVGVKRENVVPQAAQTVHWMCQTGNRSCLAARTRILMQWLLHSLPTMLDEFGEILLWLLLLPYNAPIVGHRINSMYHFFWINSTDNTSTYCWIII